MEIIKLIDFRSGPQIISAGKDCFRSAYNELKDRYNKKGVDIPLGESRQQPSLDKALHMYTMIYKKHESDLGHYFITLYNIFKFVDESSISDKKKYIKLVRAQLSSFELIFLFYNCLSPNGEEKFKPLVEKYAILKNVNFSLLLDPTHRSAYNPEAFGLVRVMVSFN